MIQAAQIIRIKVGLIARSLIKLNTFGIRNDIYSFNVIKADLSAPLILVTLVFTGADFVVNISQSIPFDTIVKNGLDVGSSIANLGLNIGLDFLTKSIPFVADKVLDSIVSQVNINPDLIVNPVNVNPVNVNPVVNHNLFTSTLRVLLPQLGQIHALDVQWNRVMAEFSNYISWADLRSIDPFVIGYHSDAILVFLEQLASFNDQVFTLLASSLPLLHTLAANIGSFIPEISHLDTNFLIGHNINGMNAQDVYNTIRDLWSMMLERTNNDANTTASHFDDFIKYIEGTLYQ